MWENISDFFPYVRRFSLSSRAYRLLKGMDALAVRSTKEDQFLESSLSLSLQRIEILLRKSFERGSLLEEKMLQPYLTETWAKKLYVT